MTDQLPLISCLCVTGNSINFLKRAIHCFNQQSYPNKELVLVYGSDNTQTNAYLNSLNDPRVRGFQLDDNNSYSLGEKRNFAIEKSNGEYFCQWDDDDWYHPDRLKEQLEPLLKSFKDGSILIFEIVFDDINKRAYGSTIRPLEHSIMCRKSVYLDGIKYSNKDKGEDFDFIKSLKNNNMLFPIVNPGLYVYVYHGKNSYPAEHFTAIFDFGFILPDAISVSIEKILSQEYSIGESAMFLKSEEFLKPFNYFNRFPYK
jgi:glycosyltransferase involved in cell wall biosynthesis